MVSSYTQHHTGTHMILTKQTCASLFDGPEAAVATLVAFSIASLRILDQPVIQKGSLSTVGGARLSLHCGTDSSGWSNAELPEPDEPVILRERTKVL